MAILTDNNDLAAQLVEAGAQTYYNGSDTERDLSPIFLVCAKDNTFLLELMCDHGLSLAVLNSKGETPVTYASKQHKVHIVNYLSLR